MRIFFRDTPPVLTLPVRASCSRKKILTVYKEQALLTARLLRDSGPLRVEEVKDLGGPPNAASILSRNVLGWFEREAAPEGRLYLYRVSDKGLEALAQYEDIL